MAQPTFEIRPLGPWSWGSTLDMLSRWEAVARHAPGGEDDVVRLAFPSDGTFQPVAVALRGEDGVLRGQVAGTDDMEAARAQVARFLSLDRDATTYRSVGERDPVIGRLMSAVPGLRPVLFTSPFEAAAWAVISQRISMAQASRVVEALGREHGQTFSIAGGEAVSFPSPERLARLEEVPGLAAAKVARLHGVAEAALDGRLDAARLVALGREEAGRLLRTIPGIGPFWSDGIYLRACGVADEWPDEPRTARALADAHGLAEPPTGEALQHLTDPCRPWRMWVAVLLRVASARGFLSPNGEAG